MHTQKNQQPDSDIRFTDRFGNTIEVTDEGEHLRLTKNGLISSVVTIEHFRMLIARKAIIQLEEGEKEENEELAA